MAFDPSKGGSSSLFQSFMGNRATGGGSPVFGAFGMPQQQQQPDSIYGFGGRSGNRGLVGSGNGGVIGDWGPGGGQAPGMDPIKPTNPQPDGWYPVPQPDGWYPVNPRPDGLPVQPMPRSGPGIDGLPVQPMPRTGPGIDGLPVQPMPQPAPMPDGLPVQPMPRPGGGSQGNSGLAEAVRGLQRHQTNGNLYFDQSGNPTTLQHFANNFQQQARQAQQAQQQRGPSQAQLLAQHINQNALSRWNQR